MHIPPSLSGINTAKLRANERIGKHNNTQVSFGELRGTRIEYMTFQSANRFLCYCLLRTEVFVPSVEVLHRLCSIHNLKPKLQQQKQQQHCYLQSAGVHEKQRPLPRGLNWPQPQTVKLDRAGKPQWSTSPIVLVDASRGQESLGRGSATTRSSTSRGPQSKPSKGSSSSNGTSFSNSLEVELAMRAVVALCAGSDSSPSLSTCVCATAPFPAASTYRQSICLA